MQLRRIISNAPVRDIPQAINIVPPELLRDRAVTNFYEAIKTVPGISQSTVSQRNVFENPVIRGFTTRNTLRDGIWDDSSRILGYDAAIVERIEILKGPASVLYGQGGLGGTINYVTKPPLSTPLQEGQFSVGNNDAYRAAFDFSGPLNNDKSILYRLNVAAQTEGGVVDTHKYNRYTVSPNLTWLISDKTKLDFRSEYIDGRRTIFDSGLPVIGSILPNPNGQVPRNRYLGEIDDIDNFDVLRIGYDFEHRFNDDWKVKNGFRVGLIRLDRISTNTTSLQANNRTVNRSLNQQDFRDDDYGSDTYVVGKFNTGSIKHELTTGVALSRLSTFTTNRSGTALPIDLYNPVYNQPRSALINPNPTTFIGDSVGIYLQDQIGLSDSLKVLLGGRFDMANQRRAELASATQITTTGSNSQQVFSPRVGVVYQPTPAVSLYTSYGQSFLPTQSAFARFLPLPELGTQYEAGVKVDLNKQLSATLAFYDLTRTNLLNPDPVNPLLVIQTGKQKSQGIEFDLTGEISPGWNVFAGYAYTDARIAEDRALPVGNLLVNVPKHSFNLWTKYELQSGDLKGLGFGLGLFYADSRKGDLLNTFELPSYVRTDAAISYQKDDLRFALNFQNLFNVDYFESALNRTRVYRGDPFTVKATVGYNF